MTTFTELLDEYLEAKAEVAELKSNFAGYDFDYYHFKECERLRDARTALNVAYLQAADKTPITFGSIKPDQF